MLFSTLFRLGTQGSGPLSLSSLTVVPETFLFSIRFGAPPNPPPNPPNVENAGPFFPIFRHCWFFSPHNTFIPHRQTLVSSSPFRSHPCTLRPPPVPTRWRLDAHVTVEARCRLEFSFTQDWGDVPPNQNREVFPALPPFWRGIPTYIQIHWPVSHHTPRPPRFVGEFFPGKRKTPPRIANDFVIFPCVLCPTTRRGARNHATVPTSRVASVPPPLDPR